MRWTAGLGETPALPNRFLLCVGHRRAYKNFLGVAPALARLMRADQNLGLVCFGGGPFIPEEEAPFEAAGVRARLVAMAGDDRALAAAYAHAVALIYPSLYEGFGMPILEAMINRCPVIIPRTSCFPEIAEDAAVYFDPAHPENLGEIVKRVLSDPVLRRTVAEVGARRAADFSWQHCADRHAELYRTLAS